MSDRSAVAADAGIDAWLAELARAGELGRLLRPDVEEQARHGYLHTLREIAQQPVTWQETQGLVDARRNDLEAVLASAGINDRSGALVFTGSGSSLFVGECVAGPLQEALGASALAVSAGLLLTHPAMALPPSGPFLMVSIARSGNSPESCAALDMALESHPRGRHLVFTCNREGALATAYPADPRVTRFVLPDATNDRSLVMTSSFTNLVLAGLGLDPGHGSRAAGSPAAALGQAGRRILREDADALAAAGRSDNRQVVYLGSGCRAASARESALKMLEMTAGRTSTLAESYLGLRHGPMSALRPDTLLVAFVSSDRVARAFEADLLDELSRKGLCRRRVLVGSSVRGDLRPQRDDLVVECGPAVSDPHATLLDALVGQLLAFFRCRAVGLHPDAPSDGIIDRVVGPFTIHRRIPS